MNAIPNDVMFDRELNAPDDSPPTFRELREQTMAVISDEESNGITDDVYGDAAGEWGAILCKWKGCRDANDQLAFGIFMDEWFERHINENCYLASR